MADQFLEDGGTEFFFEESTEESGLNITPMVDVIFILLVFFLCVSQLKSGQLKVVLPKVDKSPEIVSADKKKPIVVQMSAGGKIAIGDQVFTDFSPIKAALAKLVKEKGEDHPVSIECDEKVTMGRTSRVFALMMNAGFRKVSLPVNEEGQ
ncbi:MAG: biopolymer transporter ExbD [Planctomycetota bacterium]|nr:biopolymer transporter ExbD [Planctomycetota bacterium]